MPRYDKSATPPEKRRKPKGTVAGKVQAPLTVDEMAALAFLVQRLKTEPIEAVPANDSGAIGLALLREARRQGLQVPVPGWPDPEPGSKEDPAKQSF